jgi:arylsulfatase A-like enzyme
MLLIGLAALGFASRLTAAKPNIVVIISDDQGYADLGVHGCKDVPTPHIDSIAKAGTRCTSGYVSGPYCSPTRAGLMTGRYQQRFGHEFNPGAPDAKSDDVGLSLNEKTLAEKLKAAGYRTGMVGKWHLGHADKFHPLSRGFESYYGFLGGAHTYLKPGAGLNAVVRGKEPVADIGEYLTETFGREAVDYIGKNATEPFFLYLAFNAVHGPLEASDKYLKRFDSIQDEKRRKYAAMLSALDDAVGAVLDKIKAAGVEDNTLVMFVSDNGGPEQVNASDNGPLRGVKATTWEGGVRVPFLVKWPGRVPAGKTYDHPVIQLDMHATALAAAGAKLDGNLDGVDLLPYLAGQKTDAPHDALYWRFGGQMAIRAGDWKLVKAADEGGRAGGGGAEWRRQTATVEGAKLFNLKDDIGEQIDLAAKHPDKTKELAGKWEKWNATLAKPTWGPPVRKKD